jgi:phosphomannomutase/phosphoglucomutase
MDIKIKAPGGEHLQKLALPLAVVLGLLALWLAWSGVSQWRDGQRETELTRARDSVAQSIGSVVKARTAQLGKLLEAAPVRAALAPEAAPAPAVDATAAIPTPPPAPIAAPVPDFAAVAAALKAAWPQAESVEVWPANMSAQFAALPKGGYGQLAAAEAALVAKAPIARLGQAGGQKLLVAAPVPAGDAPAAVAVVRLPPAAVIDPLRTANMPGSGYLALRQGTATVLERGDLALANGAEALAAKIPGTDLRIAAGLPEAAAGAFGLSAIPSLIGALVLAGLAFLAWFRLGRGTGTTAVASPDAAGDAPTLAQALADAPLPVPEAPTPKVAVPADPVRVAVAIDRGIFRAYDIRGVVGQTLDAGVAELIGQAIGSQMQEQGLEDIVVGRDGRLSGPDLVAGLVAGLRKAGRNVIDIGMAPTPLVYFGSFHLRTGCCVAVTGSHNPPDYNGFKIVIGGETLSGKAITGLHDRIAEDRLFVAPTPGTLSERDISQDYVDRIAGDVQADRRLKVVVDAGNGVAGGLGPRVLEALGADVWRLYC